MAALRPVAVVVDLVDKPGGRKAHHGDIPVVGGLAMFLGCTFALGLVAPLDLFSTGLISAAALVVLVGLLDDRFELSPYARLTTHLVAAILVLSASNLSISTLGNPFGGEGIHFGPTASAIFTCVAVVGAINAFNMLDGMDGLAGTTAFTALVGLAILGGMIGDIVVLSASAICCSSVAAFLIFNIPARFNRGFRCFMGDAGSTLLGFLLACLCIGISQGTGPKVSPTVTLWLVAIPLYELLWTTMRRLLRGQSPFRPDRAHFHHKLLDAGFGVRGAFFVLVSIGSMFAAIGLMLHAFNVSDSISFGLWLLSGVAMVVLMNRATVLWRIVPDRFRRTGVAEVL